MLRFVNLAFRTLLVVGLLLAQRGDCMRAADAGAASHAHASGDACHDDAAAGTHSGHGGHGDDGGAEPQCPASHACPTVAAVEPPSLQPSALPSFTDAPPAVSRSLASITRAPDRRPPKG